MDTFTNISNMFISPYRKGIMNSFKPPTSQNTIAPKKRIQRCHTKTILSDWTISKYSSNKNGYGSNKNEVSQTKTTNDPEICHSNWKKLSPNSLKNRGKKHITFIRK
ncbi:hypothetical protein AYI69_g10097 [Smittium culicis]|uniref:Uncharacterized protein n=1 Tax=Smittium culicis TaxID=133412 RepID=A0A1R1X847_9FUNG|nr:hypothetical protein AYI69_g10097 [Smittium culicis]